MSILTNCPFSLYNQKGEMNLTIPNPNKLLQSLLQLAPSGKNHASLHIIHVLIIIIVRIVVFVVPLNLFVSSSLWK